MSYVPRWLRRTATDGSVYVSERFGVRSLHIGSDTIQSSMRLARPNDLELAYTRSMMAFLLFNPRPDRILLVGLGGGSLAKFIYYRIPEATTEVVEVNPQVVAIARRLFGVPFADERLAIRVCDGAQYMASDGPRYGAILVDGYDGDSQAEELASRAFYEACLRRLTEHGVLVVNLWGSDRRFGEYLARIEETFSAGTLCLPAEKPGNVIVLAFRGQQEHPRWDDLKLRAGRLSEIYGLEFAKFAQGLRKMNRCDGDRLYISNRK